MAGSTYGNILKMTTFGESHGKAIGVVLDGLPAGLPLSEEDIQPYLDRRRPGANPLTSPRKEADRVQILSGLFEGKTLGTPLTMLVFNEDAHSKDYDALRTVYRPGHADYTYAAKYGHRDHRGGGRSSGRETIGRVCAGAVCEVFLRHMGMEITAYTQSIGPVSICEEALDLEEAKSNETRMPDKEANAKAMAYLEEVRAAKDSAGGVIACRINGVPAGLGDPVFEKLDANLAKALFSIGAVKAVEVGAGTAASLRRGSENNDPFTTEMGGVTKLSNHAGGILGGISDGDTITLRVHIKPTPSIAQSQQTIDENGAPAEIQIQGRHDPVILPRAVVVVECMCAFVILDALLLNLSARAEDVFAFYNRDDR